MPSILAPVNDNPVGNAPLVILNVIVPPSGSVAVEEHQEDAGDRQQDEQEEGQAAEAQRVADLDGVTLHLHRVQVVQHRVHDHVGPVSRAVGVALPEDRARSEDRVPGLGGLGRVDELGCLVLQSLRQGLLHVFVSVRHRSVFRVRALRRQPRRMPYP